MNPTPDSKSGRLFEEDCCPGLVYLRAQYADHTAGAEGQNHRDILKQLDTLAENQEKLINVVQSMDRRQYYFMGAMALLVSALTFLGPERIKQFFTAAAALLTGGWLA